MSKWFLYRRVFYVCFMDFVIKEKIRSLFICKTKERRSRAATWEKLTNSLVIEDKKEKIYVKTKTNLCQIIRVGVHLSTPC